jgi:hypothetical protein
MKKLLIATLFALAASQAAVAGNCDYSWQTASDGSACGGRSAQDRPGGK